MRIASLDAHLAVIAASGLVAAGPGCAGSARRERPVPGPATVSGRLLGPGFQALPGGRVRLVVDPAADRVPVADVASGNDGGFEIGGIPPGRYVLGGTAKGFSGSQISVAVRAGESVATILRLEAAHVLGGVVQDRRSQPIPYARLSVAPVGGGAAGPDAIDARSDGTGRFVLAGLPRGRYRVRVDAPGLGGVEIGDLAVPAPQLVVTLDSEGRFLTGQVSSGGAPAEGALVMLAGAEIGDPRTMMVASDGRFGFGGLGPGKYLLRASRGSLLGLTRTPVEVRGNGSPHQVKIDLGPGAMVGGRVVDDRGMPFADTEVEIVADPPDGFPLRTRTDPKGAFQIGPCGPGDYQLGARRPGTLLESAPRVFVPAGPVVSPPEQTLRLLPAARLVGRVVDARGEPMAGAAVRADLAASGNLDGGPAVVRGELPLAAEAAARPSMAGALPAVTVARALSGPDGRFVLADVPPGVWRIEGSHPQALSSRIEAVPVTGTGDVDLGTITLATGVSVIGRVFDEAGVPLPGARIGAVGGAKGGAVETTTLPSGEFRLRVGPGDYTVEASASGRDVVATQVRAAADGVPPPLAFTLGRADGVLEGTVRDTAGRALPRVRLGVRSSPGLSVAVGAALPPATADAGLRPLAEASTDAGGHFRIGKLPRRRLVLDIRHPDFPPVSLAAEPGSLVQARLANPGGVAGEVREKGTGAFVARYRLAASGPEGRTAAPSRTTGAGFELLRLFPGRWSLTVEAPGFERGSVAVDVPPAGSAREPSVRDLRIELERQR